MFKLVLLINIKVVSLKSLNFLLLTFFCFISNLCYSADLGISSGATFAIGGGSGYNETGSDHQAINTEKKVQVSYGIATVYWFSNNYFLFLGTGLSTNSSSVGVISPVALHIGSFALSADFGSNFSGASLQYTFGGK